MLNILLIQNFFFMPHFCTAGVEKILRIVSVCNFVHSDSNLQRNWKYWEFRKFVYFSMLICYDDI